MDAVSKTKIKRWVTILIILVLVIISDQVTKELAREYLSDSPTISYWGNSFLLHYAENDGAFLSMSSNWPVLLRTIFLTIIPVVFLLILFFVVLFSKDMDNITTIAFALILGGGISNMWDRIFNSGFVVDFMNIGIGNLRTGIFNVADMAITCAFFMIVIRMIMQRIKQKKESA